MLTFRCSQCTQPLQVGENQVGQSARCPRCQLVQKVPASRAGSAPGSSPETRDQHDLPTIPPSETPPPLPGLLILRCTRCSQPLQLSQAHKGREVRCPRCQQVLQVPPQGVGSPLPNGHGDRTPVGLQKTLDLGDSEGGNAKETPTAPPVPPHQKTAAQQETVPQPRAPISPLVPFPGQAHPEGYEILAELGRGGMGVVYKARDLQLNRMVALKMVLSGAHADQQELARFRREALAVARLQHPNIVQIYEVGEHNNLPYCALEFCEGGNLAQCIAGNVLSPGRAADWAETLARTVHEVHLQGIIHRDLKPANVLLTQSGVPKITDFGLAKRVDEGSLHTRTGAVVGTPVYMAPEQAAGKSDAVGPATDVYALGTILYEMLTGRSPFAGPVQIVLFSVVHLDPPAPSTLNPKVPRDLETICLKCMHKEQRRRYASALELAEDIQRFRQGKPVKARPISGRERLWRWGKRNPSVAALVGLVALLLVAVAVGGSLAAAYYNQKAEEARRAETRAVQSQQEAEAARSKEAEQRQLAERAIQESRRFQSWRSAGNGWRTIQENPLGALPWFAESLRLAEGNVQLERFARIRLGTLLRQYPLEHLWFGVRSCTFSPGSNGETLLATTHDDGTARVWHLSTGEAITPVLKHDPAPTDPVLAPGATSSSAVLHARFRKDGKCLVTAGMDHTARVWEVPSGKLLLKLKHNQAVWHAEFSADGNRIATASVDGTLQTWEANTGVKLGKPWRISKIVTFSSDGALVVGSNEEGKMPRTFTPVSAPAPGVPGGVQQVQIWELFTGKALTGPLNPGGMIDEVAFSTNGKMVTRIHRPGAGGAEVHLQVWDVATGKAVGQPIVRDTFTSCVAISPDGERLAVGGWGAQLYNVDTGKTITPYLPIVSWSANSNRENQGSSPGGPGIMVAQIAFSPKGQRVVMLSRPSHPSPEPGGKPRPWMEKSSVGAGRPAVVSDGKSAVLVWDTRTGELLTAPVEHNNPLAQVTCSPDGEQVLTRTSTEQEGGVRIWRLGKGRTLARPLPGCPLEELVFDPTGRRLFVEHEAGKQTHRQVWDLATGKQVALPEAWPLQWMEVTRVETKLVERDQQRQSLTSRGKRKTVVYKVAVSMPVFVKVRQLFHKEAIPGPPSRSSEALREVTLKKGLSRLAVSGDGRLLVTRKQFGTTGEVRVWEMRTGKPVTPPLLHKQSARQAVFSGDYRLLAVLSGDATVRVWDVRTGYAVTPILTHTRRIATILLSPDGKRLVTVDAAGEAPGASNPLAKAKPQVWVWDLLPDPRATQELALRAQLISGQRVDATGNLEPLSPEELRNDRESLRFYNPPDTIASSPRALLAWHRKLAQEHEVAGQWVAAMLHLSKLIDAKPRDWNLWIRRGNALAEAQRLPEALADLTRACELGAEDPALWYNRAILLLALKKTKQYRQLCTEIQKRFGDSKDENLVELADQSLWTCVLAPAALPQWNKVLQQARSRLTDQPDRAEYLVTLGATLYRAGQHDAAITQLQGLPGVNINRRKPITTLSPRSAIQRVHARAFLALALHHAGKTKEATDFGYQVGDDVRQLTRTPPFSSAVKKRVGARIPWNQRFVMQLLNQEVTEELKLLSAPVGEPQRIPNPTQARPASGN